MLAGDKHDYKTAHIVYYYLCIGFTLIDYISICTIIYVNLNPEISDRLHKLL